MYRAFVAFILVLSLAACGTKVEENDGAELTSLMQNNATSVETGTGMLPNMEYSLKYIRKRIGQTTIVKAFQPPTVVRTNPSVHVSDLTVRGDYHINRHYVDTSWFFKRNEETSAWTLSTASLKDVQKSNLMYKPEKVFLAALGRLSWSGFESLQPSSGWQSPNDLSPLLPKTFQALANNDLETLKSVTLTGALLRAEGKGIDISRLIAADLPDREFDNEGATQYLKDQVAQTSEIMKYCEAKPEDILPYITAYTVASVPEGCNRVSLAIEFTNPDIGSGITVGNRAMKGFTVEWAAVRVKDVWLIDNLLINCLVTDMAKSFYGK
jgi:hypothetical protein